MYEALMLTAVTHTNVHVGSDPSSESTYRLCYDVFNVPVFSAPFEHYINCTQPLKGRYIRVMHKSYWSMTLCEVQVFGYIYRGMNDLKTVVRIANIRDIDILLYKTHSFDISVKRVDRSITQTINSLNL